MTEDVIRVLRIIEYIGPRSVVEKAIERSIIDKTAGQLRIRGATLGMFPEILERARPSLTAEDVEEFLATREAESGAL